MNSRVLLASLTCGLALSFPRCSFALAIPEIDVNTTTGDVTLNTHGLSIGGYEIDSNGHLVPGNWDSLVAQSLVANWQVLIANSNIVAEAYSPSMTLYTSSTPADLGNIFQPGSPEDLAFLYVDANSDTLNGNIVYYSVPEPASALLCALGAVALLVVARRSQLRD